MILVSWCFEGLDVEKDHIIEMACIITDGDLRVIEEVSLSHPIAQQFVDHWTVRASNFLVNQNKLVAY